MAVLLLHSSAKKTAQAFSRRMAADTKLLRLTRKTALAFIQESTKSKRRMLTGTSIAAS
jgi:hypothetical protein